MFCFSPLKKCRKEYNRLIKLKHDLISAEDVQSKPGDEFDLVDKQINDFVEGKYAEEVFRYYQRKQPALIRVRTGEEVSWREAFGDSFEAVSTSLKHSLVGLVEGGGRYKIKK